MLNLEERKKYVSMAKEIVAKHGGEFANVYFYPELFIVEYWDHRHHRGEINREILMKNRLYEAEIYRKLGYRVLTPPPIPKEFGRGAS